MGRVECRLRGAYAASTLLEALIVLGSTLIRKSIQGGLLLPVAQRFRSACQQISAHPSERKAS